MRDDDYEYRTRLTLRPRAQITTIIATALLVPGVYFLFAPVTFVSTAGNIKCGTALARPSTEFARNICNGATEGNLAKALLCFALALVIGGLGIGFFGIDRRTETRPVSDAERRGRYDQDEPVRARNARRYEADDEDEAVVDREKRRRRRSLDDVDDLDDLDDLGE